MLRSLSQVLNLDYNYLLVHAKMIDDEPEIRIIQRAARNMSQEEKKRMLEILRLAFKDAFKGICDDEGLAV